MKITQAIKMAFTSLLSNKMRTFLTMLGIIIGIASVIDLIALGNGSKEAVTKSIEGMGTNLLTVSLTGSKNVTITNDEITSLEKESDSTIKEVAPELGGTATVKAGTENSTASIEASLPNYGNVRDVDTAYGRFITQDDVDNRYNVCDIGPEVIQNLYPDLDVKNYDTLIGQNLLVNGTQFQIIGILESKGTSTAGSNDNRLIIPLSTGEKLLSSTRVRTYYIECSSPDKITLATNYLDFFLNQKFNNDTSQYRVLSQSDMLETRSATVNTMTTDLAGIAAISLLVGGIGIMNIMLVSVVERTREIGIRKAIGAKRRDIMLQFLIEALFISCLGGLLGVGIGALVSLILPKFISNPMVMSPSVMLLAFGFSAGVGIIFGIYPAAKASKLRPIDALQYE